MRTCKKCNTVYPGPYEDFFYYSNQTLGYFSKTCKACTKPTKRNLKKKKVGMFSNLSKGEVKVATGTSKGNLKTIANFGYIYIMKIYNKINGKFTGKCKIGYSKRPFIRVSEINKEWSDTPFEFHLHKISNACITMVNIVEANIHFLLSTKGMHYLPKPQYQSLEGSTEIFLYEEWLDNLLP